MAVERHQKRGRGRPSLEEVLTTVDEEVALLHDHLGGLPRDVEADEVLHEIWLDDVTVKEAEKQVIMRALKETNGNRTLTAKKIGMSRRTLHRKLHLYHLENS